MLRFAPAILLGCSWGYGPAVDRGRFESALLHEDGVRCIFAFHDVVYRPATGMRAFPDGGVPRYLVDRAVVGVVDVPDGSAQTLVVRENRDFLPGHGALHLSGVRGSHALISQGGQGLDYGRLHRWFHLDLQSHELEALPLAAELAERGQTLRHPLIVDDGFTLVLLTDPASGSGPRQAWLREADGSMRWLATSDQLYGVHEGELYWYDPARRSGARTTLASGQTTFERRADFAMPRVEPVADCARKDAGRSLASRRRGPSGWVDTPLLEPVGVPRK